MSDNLTTAEQFFYDNAGWNHDPLTESPHEGRVRCARELAAAERWAADNGYTVIWDDDSDGWYDHECNAKHDGEPAPRSCEVAQFGQWNDTTESLDIVASLGCVDDADDTYRRVVAAELALEVTTNA